MQFDRKISKNKHFELVFFEKAWPSIIDFSFHWDLKNHQRDHWGLMLCLVLLGYKILEFNFYDIRHQDGN